MGFTIHIAERPSFVEHEKGIFMSRYRRTGNENIHQNGKMDEEIMKHCQNFKHQPNTENEQKPKRDEGKMYTYVNIWHNETKGSLGYRNTIWNANKDR